MSMNFLLPGIRKKLPVADSAGERRIMKMCEERKLGNDIRVIHNMIGAYCDRYGTDQRDGVAPMQGRTLGFLYCNKNKIICQKDIEQEFLISRATASKMLQSMEKKELITRKELKEDARLKQILLTKKGEQQHLKMMNFFSGMEKLLVDGMTKEEADELSSLLKRVRSNLEKNL